ncbi:ATP-binding protein [Bacillus sp. B-jedd]|uniref:ATP-binding protein n=1 Tax=Bacillus sp. B-jedd TaxID=1476857 RepID=UPI0005156EBB|nr:ATP-binding protein [Bacillus sp. B-jedd]CEG25760.1 sporulation kinase B [Bacillus sp. B-jedd]
MLQNIELVLNQVLMVLFPIWSYHLFLHKKDLKEKGIKPKLLIVLAISLLLTLTFTVHYDGKLVFDLKLIPIIIAFLYGSNLIGNILLLIAMGYKIIIQNGDPLLTAINFAIVGSMLCILAKKFRGYSVRTKIILCSVIHWVVAFSRHIWLFSSEHAASIGMVFIFSFIAWVALLSVIFIFENLSRQIELETKVQQAEKYNVIGQLAASVAHEVRNPMTSVRGFLQLMKNDNNLTEAQKRYMEISLEELNHSQAILSEYLSLAKPAAEELSIIDLKAELEKIIELMESYTNLQTVRIYSDVAKNLPVKAESSEVKQVFVNLLKNSIEAVGSKGEIHVRAFREKNSILVEIEDNGKGMSKEQLKLLGTPFYSTKEKGTGVGLSVTYKIIHSIKGTIQVESKPGKGTKFTVRLPAFSQ